MSVKILAVTAPLAAAVLTATIALSMPASAERYGAVGYVTAESEYGNGTVTGPVRQTSVGRQVRLPGGSWIGCNRSCSETLRLETVDFWQSAKGAGQDGAITSGPGVFGKLKFGW